MNNHKPQAVSSQIMKGDEDDIPKEIVEGAEWFKCDHCSEIPKPSEISLVKALPTYASNYDAIPDVFNIREMARNTSGFLSVVCNGATSHAITQVCEGAGTPKSAARLKKSEGFWTKWAGFTEKSTKDRGLHNREMVAAHGTYLKQAALESPKMIGRGERHGRIIKDVRVTIIKQQDIIGKERTNQADDAAIEYKNDSMRRGGVDKHAHRPGSLAGADECETHGVPQAHRDGATIFGVKEQQEHTAHKTFEGTDGARRYASDMQKKSRPIDQNYQIGDIVMHQRVQGARAPGEDRIGKGRAIGFERDTLWVQHEAVPDATAEHLPRLPTTTELLACTVSSQNNTTMVTIPSSTGEHDGYHDTRTVMVTAIPPKDIPPEVSNAPTGDDIDYRPTGSSLPSESEKTVVSRPKEKRASSVNGPIVRRKPEKSKAIIKQPTEEHDKSPL